MAAGLPEIRICLRIRYAVDSRGNTPFGRDDEKANLANLDGINTIYRPCGIQFDLHPDGVVAWETDEFFNIEDYAASRIWEQHWAQSQPWVNVYYVHYLGNANGLTYSPLQFCNTNGWAVVMTTNTREYYTESVFPLGTRSGWQYRESNSGRSAGGLAHEIGHQLGLPHTYLTNVNRTGAEGAPEPNDAERAQVVEYLNGCMRPFGDDTDDATSDQEMMNPMSYWWKANPPDPKQFVWTENQIKRLRLTFFSRISDTAYAAAVPSQTLSDRQETILLPDLCARFPAWMG